MKVSELMSSPPITASPDELVARVRVTMKNRHIGAMPVLDDSGTLLGIISATDLVADAPDGLPIRNVMAANVITVPDTADVGEAAWLFRNHYVHHLVVVSSEDGRVVGMLSTFDLIRLLEA